MRYIPSFRSLAFDARPPVYDCDFTQIYNPTDLANKGWTFGRTGIATYVDENGNLIYNCHNLCTSSQEPASWVAAKATGTNNVTTAPDGTTTAGRINEDTGLGSVHGLACPAISSSGIRDAIVTYSAYVKQDPASSPARYTCLLMATNGATRFTLAVDMTNGNVLGLTYTSDVMYRDYGVTPLQNNWYRIWVRDQMPYARAANNTQIGIYLSDSAQGVGPTFATNANAPQYNGKGASAGMFMWGAQVEVHPSPRDYIPTTTAAVYWPRLHSTKGLLLEGTLSNLLNWSETFGTTAAASSALNWVYTGITTSTGTTSPNSITTAVRFKHDGSTTGSATIGMSGPIGTSTNRCFSVWAKQISGTGNAWWSYNKGITQTAFTGMSSGWQRYEFVYTNLNHQLLLGICAANDEFEFWGAQLELAGWPTSYISSANAAAARAADACGILSPSPNFINSDYGSLYADYAVNSAGPAAGSVTTFARVAAAGSSGANYFLGSFTVPGGALGTYSVDAHRANFAYNNLQTQAGNTALWTSGEFRKAALNYIGANISGTTFAGFISGSIGRGTTTPYAGISNLNRIDLCVVRNNSTITTTRDNCQGSMWIKRLKYWNAYLSNTDLQKLTGVSG